MNYKILLFFLLFINMTSANNNFFINGISFNTNPIIASTSFVCLNSSPKPIVTLTASSSSSTTFVYTINRGSSTTIISNTNSVSLEVPTSVAGTFEYTFVSYTDDLGEVTSVNQSVSIVVGSTVFPSAELNGTGKFLFNGSTVFKICGNSASEFEFVNASTTIDTNTEYTIDWGDGVVERMTNWSTKKHTYTVGYYNLVYTVSNSAGCSSSKTYKVFLGSNPAVGFAAALNADICVGSTLSFPLSGTANNPPGTTYIVSFSDGSNDEFYTQDNLPESITHKFNENSCGYNYISGSSFIPNSFSGTVKAINPCGTAVVSVGPIFVSAPPKAEITVPKNNCINTVVCIQNTSKGSVDVSSGSASCNSSPATVWTITPNTGFTLSPGSSLGNDYGSNNIGLWAKGSDIICPTFTVAGTYEIRMRVGNRCGVSETISKINVDLPLIPQFSVDLNAGCSPLIINTSNSTVNTNISETPTYQWEVSYTTGDCDLETPLWEYTSSTNEISKEPKLLLKTPGFYKIKLEAVNSCGAVTTNLQQVQVSKMPDVSIDPLPDMCQEREGEPVVILPTASINSCADEGNPVSYEWSFPGGTPARSTGENPVVTYLPGTYTISLSYQTNCGITIASDRILSISAIPKLIITNPPPVCAPQTVDLFDEAIKMGSDGDLDYTYWMDSLASIPLEKPYKVAVSGTYFIKATHKFTGCIVIKPVVVEVNPISTIIGDSEMCLGGSAVQLLTNPEHTLDSPWKSSDPTVASISSTGLINSLSVGFTEISFTDQKGCIVKKPFFVNTLISIKKNPQSTQTICVGGQISPLVVDYAGGAGLPKYEWYSNTIPSNSGGTLINDANEIQFSPPVYNTTGKFYYYAVISISGNGCGVAVSEPAEVIVLDNIKIIQQPLTYQSLCKNAIPTSLKVEGIGGSSESYSYQWYKSSISNDKVGRLIPFEIYNYFIPPTSNIGVDFYYCEITQINNGCKISSTPSKVEVFAPPKITLNPASGGVCLGSVSNPLIVRYKDGAGMPSYQWYVTTSILPQFGSPITGATNDTFIPPSSSLGTFYYYCVISFTGSGCSEIRSDVAKIVVSTYPKISPINIFTCSGAFFEIIPKDGGDNVVPVGTTYTWDLPSISDSNAIKGATRTTTGQSSIQQGLINSTTSLVDVVYSVTPNSGGCIGENFKLIAQVNPDIVINSKLSPIKCSGGNNASIELYISGGTAPFQTTWSNLGGGLNQNNLSAGDYTVIVTDAKGCTKESTLTIVEPPVFRVDATVREISCFGANNGSINLNIIGGKAPFKLLWTDDPLAGKDRNNLKPGVYVVSVSDGTGCTINKTFNLINPLNLLVSANLTNAFDCIDANSGAINLIVSGGTSPFSFQWSNGSNTKDLTSIPSGNYSVKVSDSRGCSTFGSYTIYRKAPIIVSVETSSHFDCESKLVKQFFTAKATGGVVPYHFNWFSGEVSGENNEIMTTSHNGLALLKVKDGLGCEASFSFNVKIPIIGNPGFTINSIGQTTYGVYSIKDPIYFMNKATGDFESIVWDFGDGSLSTEINPKHSYLNEGEYIVNQKVSYSGGCTYNYKVSLKLTKGYEVMIPNAFSPNNNGLNDTFKPVFKGLSKIRMEIFNTWGGLLYSEEGQTLKGWTGIDNGKLITNGIYYYRIIATSFYGDEVIYNGPFLMLM